MNKHHKSFLKATTEWGLALLISILILNCLIVPLYHFAPWIDIPCNATTGLFAPNSRIVYGLEGFSIRDVDTNGYANPTNRQNYENYILVMGSSHSVGKEVAQGKNYVDLLEKNGKLNIYNIAMDGNYFIEIMQGFDSALEQFQDANSIVIEINSVNYSHEELLKAHDIRTYDYNYTGKNIFQTLSLKNKFKLYIQDYLPLMRQIQRNLKSNNSSNINTYSTNSDYDSNEYLEDLNSIFEEKRKIYDGNIVIVYHPNIVINEEGNINIVKEYQVDNFKSACIDNGIEFIDVSDDFIELYQNTHKIPYGFYNTILGTGHLNKHGHQIIYEKLINYFK